MEDLETRVLGEFVFLVVDVDVQSRQPTRQALFKNGTLRFLDFPCDVDRKARPSARTGAFASCQCSPGMSGFRDSNRTKL